MFGFLLVIIPPHISFAQTVTLTPTPAFAVIINQVRGESCCSPGNLDNTRAQLDNAVRLKLPTTFVLRYDALTDQQYTDLFRSYKRLHPDLIQIGVMAEIIPRLIADANAQQCQVDPSTSLRMTEQGDSGLEGQRAISAAEMSEESDNNKVPDEFLREEIGCCPEIMNQTTQERDSSSSNSLGMTEECVIQYRGTDETWFQAQNAFTIGYPIPERKLILDTLLTQYQNVFGTYPTVSSAWMIDTDSVNYLHDKYGVITHQITREQWGTDSYTLYGGPPHYPYPASRNWLMIPDFDENHAVTIVRQTVTDPLYNYGDTSSSYTSQPNDYMRGGRGIEYFKTLIDNAIRQKSTGFANIGLENSMGEQYQNEFALQLEYIAKLRDENMLQVIFADAVGPHFQNEKVTSYARSEGKREAVWVTTPSYRIRIIRNNNEVTITDLRLYSKDLKDPYSTRVAKHEGYWVTPFLVDGSRWYAWKGTETYPHKFIPIMMDLFDNPTGIVIAKNAGALSVSTINDSISINDDENQNFADFYTDYFNLPNNLALNQALPNQFPVTPTSAGGLAWNLNGKSGWKIQKTNCSRLCKYTIAISATLFSDAVSQQYPYLYPESVGRQLSEKYTRVSVNNAFALAGRNPVRLVLEPHDGMNFPIILDQEAEITVDPDDTVVTRLGKLVSSQQQYVDLDRGDPHKVDVTVTMNQGGKYFSSSSTVYFAPNCKKGWRYCVAHPVQGVWYVLTKITDQLSGRR